MSCLATSACSLFEPSIKCPAIQKPALRVRLQDATSGAAIGKNGIIISRRRENNDVDTTHTLGVSSGPDSLLFLVGDLPGTYDLRTVLAGYSDWMRDGITVTSTDDGCQPVTVDINASMLRLGGYPAVVMPLRAHLHFRNP
jgi:hypothetical protein